MASSSAKEVTRMVILGKTGSGKSATGNTLLGKDSFKTVLAGSSVTEKCFEAKATVSGRDILLVDTPGAFDTSVSNKVVLKEVAKCISLSLPGPHVFLLVIRIGRFTEEEKKTVEHYENVFGEEMFNHMILVFTGQDALNKGNISFQEFLRKVPPSLQEILQKCNNRCVAVDNTSDKSSRDTDAGEVMKLVDALLKKRDGKCYTNDMYQIAETKCREREENVRLKMTAEKQKEKEDIKKKLEKEYQEKIDRLEAEKNIAERSLSLRERDQRIAVHSRDLDYEYERRINNLIARENADATFSMFIGALGVGCRFGWLLSSMQ